MELPPLNKVDESTKTVETTTLNFPTCKHELYIVSSTEARCKRCGVGYSGHGIIALVKASQA